MISSIEGSIRFPVWDHFDSVRMTLLVGEVDLVSFGDCVISPVTWAFV